MNFFANKVLPQDCTNCNFDLKPGFSEFVPHLPHQNGLDPLLKWIMNNKSILMNEPTTQNPNK